MDACPFTNLVLSLPLGLHSSVQKDVQKLMSGKSVHQLEKIEKDINRKLEGHGEAVDVAYWESLSNDLHTDEMTFIYMYNIFSYHVHISTFYLFLFFFFFFCKACELLL